MEEKIEKRKAELQPEVVARLTGKEIDQAASTDVDASAMLPLLEAEREALEKNLATANQGLDIQMRDLDKPESLLIVAGSGQRKVPLAALDSQGKARWSLEMSAAVAHAAICSQRPWLALSLQDGSVRIVDLVAGNQIAHLGGEDGDADVAWLPVDEAAPLLVIAADGKLQAYRIAAEQP